MSIYAARVRAARAFADLTQKQLADELGVDEQTIKRRERGSQDPKKGERRAIAAICGVPASFMEHGFGEVTSSELEQSLSRIEALLAEPTTAAEFRRSIEQADERDRKPAGTSESARVDPPGQDQAQ